MKIEKFEDIEAWKEARQLVKEIYIYFIDNKDYGFQRPNAESGNIDYVEHR
jgi:hypothetical protein